MKTGVGNYIADANRRHSFQRRLICMLCVLSLVVSAGVSLLLTMPGLTASYDPVLSNGISDPIVDPESHNGWISYFQIGNHTYNTEFVGSVWTDKSVFTEYTSSKNVKIEADDGNMLGVLSAIGSSQAITGRIYTPTDVMLILDLSSSMYKNGDATTVNAMVNAVNQSIATLLSLNDENRVGVTIYFGGGDVTVQSNGNHGKVLLGLDRYTAGTGGTYLTTLTSGSSLTGVKVTDGVKNSAGSTVTGSHTVYSPAGTYAQLGIYHAMQEFLDVSDVTASMMGQTVDRQPVFIFMSDGKPTAASVDFTFSDGDFKADFGNNQEKSRSDNEADFVTQLTAAYAKEQVGNHYNLEPLYYTLGLGEGLALSIMDPANNTNTTINGYWESLVGGSVSFTAPVYQANWSIPTLSFKVYKKDTFPSSELQRLYVDKYYPAANANELGNAFTSIVNDIILRSVYTPTQSDLNNVNQSGDVSFVDRIGQYMEIKEIKGVLMGGQLHTGAAFASTFQDAAKAEADLGTLTQATSYGLAFWNNVIQQIGIHRVYATVDEDGKEFGATVPAVAETQALITKAWEAGQLSYTSDTQFSNYIGWYQGTHSNGTTDAYLGFWDDSNQEDPIPANANARIKTYFFRDTIKGDENQTYDTNMMYVTVWVKEDIVDGKPTGQQTVVFSVPASLLPTLKYFVKLDTDGETLVDFTLGSVEGDTVFNDDGTINVRPIRLVYEVGLQSDITPQTLLEEVSTGYLNEKTNRNPETGEVYFYANEWERDGSYGENKVNTYSYFRPSTFNDRYYYVEDVPIYIKVDGEYVLYDEVTHGALEKNQDLYTQHPKYIRTAKDDGDANKKEEIQKTVFYMPLGDKVLDTADAISHGADGIWYVKAGIKHELTVTTTTTTTTTTRFERPKVEPDGSSGNRTKTLEWRNAPTQNVSNADFILASTLGNNGRISLVPDGQTLQKKLVDGTGQPVKAELDQTFRFLIHQGEPLAVDYSNPQAVLEALGDKLVSVIDLKVTAGNSESGVVPLTNLPQYTLLSGAWAAKEGTQNPPWDCINGQTYTLVELDTSDRFDPKTLGGAEGPYKFVYGEHNGVIEAVNQFTPWRIDLTKIENETTGKTLPGAVFGLYGSQEAGALQTLPEGYDDLVLEDIGTKTYDGKTWYLTAIGTTGEDGTLQWTGLTEEAYLLVELAAPPGYYMPTPEKAATLVERSAAAQPNVYAITVTNSPGYEMPSTGGPGDMAFTVIGVAIMAISAAALLVYLGKRKGEPV